MRLAPRVWILGAIALVAAACYAVVVLAFGIAAETRERRFSPEGATAGQLGIYLEPLTVDATNDSMPFRVYFTPDATLRGRRPDSPDRDLVVVLTSGDAVEQYVFRAHEKMLTASFTVDLEDGSVGSYPLDRYRAELRIRASESASGTLANAPSLPVAVTVWQGALGFHVHAREIARVSAGDLHLGFDARRPGALRFFAFAVYGAMVLLAVSSLAIGSLVFLGRRRLEATLMGALGAIIFALPALRNALPGTPPFGVRADMLVFLWAELASVIGFALFVVAWARSGERPGGR
ncbi:MAG: DUF4436 domain-containing protein [Candidatus Rokubacteria bacterium]|nr:DUF4436 domain-containing protein [Candidatus Rokubacteria bacterium]